MPREVLQDIGIAQHLLEAGFRFVDEWELSHLDQVLDRILIELQPSLRIRIFNPGSSALDKEVRLLDVLRIRTHTARVVHVMQTRRSEQQLQLSTIEDQRITHVQLTAPAHHVQQMLLIVIR
ncbi:hypothetical protein D3C84_854750 [compost metagenome]